MSQTLHPFEHHKVVAGIRNLAAEQVQHGGHDPMFVQKWADVKAHGALLAPHASAIIGTKVQGHENALSTLFTPEALAYAERKCLNTYWFWYLVSRLNTRVLPVSETAIARAHARVKDSLYDNRYGFAFIEPAPLEHQLKGLPPGFVFEMWHKGRLLAVHNPSGDYKVLLNPLLVDD